jgi:ribosomal protein S18 acetylase RimI-like enzyme
MPTIRPYRPGDRADVYDVCVATGHEGGDARGVYKSPDILPEIFAGPHLEFEPGLAFVLEAGHRVVGYILGTADTARHAASFRERWLPGRAESFPALSGPPTDLDGFMVDLMHRPERKVRPELGDYPAHLHIDILPAFQGAGHGRALVQVFLDALAAAGVPAVHLSTLKTNLDSLAFYARLGFEPLPVAHPKLEYLGRATRR